MSRYWQEKAKKYWTPITRLTILDLITGERPAEVSERVVRYFTEFLTDRLIDFQLGLQEKDVMGPARKEVISILCTLSKTPPFIRKSVMSCRTDSDGHKVRTRSHVLEVDQFTFSPRILKFQSGCFQTLIKKTQFRKLLFHLLQKCISFIFNLKLQAENMHQELLSVEIPLTDARQFNMIMCT